MNYKWLKSFTDQFFFFRSINVTNYFSSKNFSWNNLCLLRSRINSDEVVKIGDFGLSRDLHGQDYYTVGDRQRPLPVKWMFCRESQSGEVHF